MLKKNIRYFIEVFMIMTMLCGLIGCNSIDSSEGIGQNVIGVEDKQIVEQNSFGETYETALNEEHNNAEKATSGEDLDAGEPNVADNDWYMKGNIYTDDKGNRLETFFNDYGTLEFAVNGLSLYFTTVDNFQQENNWKVYTCDDGTMIIYYPGEPEHIEISNGDHAGIYESDGE